MGTDGETLPYIGNQLHSANSRNLNHLIEGEGECRPWWHICLIHRRHRAHNFRGLIVSGDSQVVKVDKSPFLIEGFYMLTCVIGYSTLLQSQRVIGSGPKLVCRIGSTLLFNWSDSQLHPGSPNLFNCCPDLIIFVIEVLKDNVGGCKPIGRGKEFPLLLQALCQVLDGVHQPREAHRHQGLYVRIRHHKAVELPRSCRLNMLWKEQ
mmetsp:Transcript_142478/g.265577  ORF Transcript_142478/g.265577 Transcript_142478/m.265577 type:complete len:207 (+) Transcript_142478:875-1495(+)